MQPHIRTIFSIFLPFSIRRKVDLMSNRQLRNNIFPILVALAMFIGCDNNDNQLTCPDQTEDPTMESQTHHVPSDYTTIKAALAAAAKGDTVLVAHGRYLEHNLVLAQDIVLRGDTNSPESVIIDAENLDRVMSCDGGDSLLIIIEGITFESGRAPGPYGASGGGLHVQHSQLRLNHCVFLSNYAGYSGGGIYGNNIDVEIANCEFNGNESDKGGASHFTNTSQVLLRECLFQANVANRTAGLLSYGTTTMTSCQFIANVGGGGSVHRAVIEHCVFRQNIGGGLSCADSSRVEFCLFVDNQTSGSGGGLVSFDFIEVLGCVFQDNAATASGGGARLYNFKMEDCLFFGNNAGENGGGIGGRIYGDLKNVKFIDNFAREGGGAISGGNNLTLEACWLMGNHSLFSSGALYAGEELVMTDCLIANNSSYDHILYIQSESESTLRLDGCTFVGNICNVDRGLIGGWNLQIFEISSSIITANQGLLVDDYAGIPTIEQTDIFGNHQGDWIDPIADQLGQAGNFSLPPLFCDPAHEEYTLCTDSPCLPHASGPDQLIGAFDNGCTSCGN